MHKAAPSSHCMRDNKKIFYRLTELTEKELEPLSDQLHLSADEESKTEDIKSEIRPLLNLYPLLVFF